VVEVAQVVVHEADEPDVVIDLFDSDIVTREDTAEVDFAAVEADAAALSDCQSAIVERVRQLR
jgi:hypothetical protein